MSYNGSGTFNINSTGQPVVAGTVITASAFNALTADLATGLTTAITKDGQTTTTARITFAQGITSSLSTDSSSTSTGSIITAGGVGIAKALYVGTTATISSLSSATATALTLQSAGTTAVTVDTSQNVGIGTASPATKLDVNGNIALPNATALQFKDSGGSRKDTLQLNASSNIILQSPSASIFQINGSTEAMRVDAGGNLLVGTTSQTGTEKFGVTQSATGSNAARFYASSTSYVNNIVEISCARSGATTEYNAFSVFDNNTTLKMLIRPNGNLLNANNSYGSLSDVSLKENIVDATPKLNELMQVKVRNYNLKDDVNKTKQIGVIAQELEQVFPAMVEEALDKDAEGKHLETTTKSVKYSVFVPMLIKAIQELKAINDTQAETINALTARITALENA